MVWLKISVSESEMTGAANLIILEEILSMLVALLLEVHATDEKHEWQ